MEDNIQFTCDGQCVYTSKMHLGIIQQFVESVDKMCGDTTCNKNLNITEQRRNSYGTEY